MTLNPNTPLEVDVQTAKVQLDMENPPLLIDCRQPNEFEVCRIEGAILIPLNETPNRLAELESHRDKPFIIHCHHGVRSLNVVNWLRDNGFPHAQSMAGGIEAWSQEIDPSVPRY